MSDKDSQSCNACGRILQYDEVLLECPFCHHSKCSGCDMGEDVPCVGCDAADDNDGDSEDEDDEE